jgi:Tfp pilus assembly protein PilN
MVTNINFTTPEDKEKIGFSGKISLILSGLLLVLALGIYAVISLFSASYAKQEKETESQIQSENAKIAGAEFTESADFQQRLNLLDKVLEDHFSFDSQLKNFSKYILPEVRLTDFSWEEGENKIVFSGTAPNFDVLSRQLILLKNAPIVQSVEFKKTDQSASTEEQKGMLVSFGISVRLKNQGKDSSRLSN